MSSGSRNSAPPSPMRRSCRWRPPRRTLLAAICGRADQAPGRSARRARQRRSQRHAHRRRARRGNRAGRPSSHGPYGRTERAAHVPAVRRRGLERTTGAAWSGPRSKVLYCLPYTWLGNGAPGRVRDGNPSRAEQIGTDDPRQELAQTVPMQPVTAAKWTDRRGSRGPAPGGRTCSEVSRTGRPRQTIITSCNGRTQASSTSESPSGSLILSNAHDCSMWMREWSHRPEPPASRRTLEMSLSSVSAMTAVTVSTRKALPLWSSYVSPGGSTHGSKASNEKCATSKPVSVVHPPINA